MQTVYKIKSDNEWFSYNESSFTTDELDGTIFTNLEHAKLEIREYLFMLMPD